MGQQYSFRIEDVTCEHCEERLQAALGRLPAVEQVELVRTPADEAEVALTTSTEVSREVIDQVVQAASTGTEHVYRVRWEPTPT